MFRELISAVSVCTFTSLSLASAACSFALSAASLSACRSASAIWEESLLEGDPHLLVESGAGILMSPSEGLRLLFLSRLRFLQVALRLFFDGQQLKRCAPCFVWRR